jgi:hypothetical protein
MARLTAADRRKLPKKDFAGPDESYPDEDEAHAKDALSRVSANGSPKVKAEVRRKVAKKYPDIKVKRGKPDYPKVAEEYVK